MFNSLLNIESDQLREVGYRVFERTDKRLYEYKGLTIGSIDGTTFSKQFASVFHMVSEQAGYTLDLEGYVKRGEELKASRKLISRLVKRFGKGFVDIILADGLYKIGMMRYFKENGIRSLIKTKEERLEPIEELELLLGSKIGKESICIERGLDIRRYEKYEIYGIETEWDGEVVKVAKVKEKKLKPAKGEEEDGYYYVITNHMGLSLIDMRELAKRRWDIENNCFKQLSSYGNTKHYYSKEFKVVENLMLIIFLSFNLMRLFKYKLERESEDILKRYGKKGITFISFVRMVGMLLKLEVTKPPPI